MERCWCSRMSIEQNPACIAIGGNSKASRSSLRACLKLGSDKRCQLNRSMQHHLMQLIRPLLPLEKLICLAVLDQNLARVAFRRI